MNTLFWGELRAFFVGVAAKKLSAVEVNVTSSNQRELNGVNPFRLILGDVRRVFPTTFLFLRDEVDDVVTTSGSLTWYDARERHPTRSEWRAYFTPGAMDGARAAVGDSLILARRPDDTIVALVCSAGSTAERQLYWLFGIDDSLGLNVREVTGEPRLHPAARIVLQRIGIDIDEKWADERALKEMMTRFPDGFPTTTVFSAWAREVAGQGSDDPDVALLEWFTLEEKLFKLMERELLGRRLEILVRDHGVNVDLIFDLMKSAAQRRRSRAGAALENHLIHIFSAFRLRFEVQPATEGKARPDFLFPGIDEYRSVMFQSGRLKMLAAKSTARDRWRQVLVEAARIDVKHMLTLEPAISTDQLREMASHRVQLVVPTPLHQTYGSDSHRLMSLSSFIDAVRSDQV